VDDEHIAEPAEVAALVAARREIGQEYDAALAESFLERVESGLEARVAALTAQQAARDDAGGKRQLVLGVVSLGVGVPISAISAGTADVPGLLVAWAGIVGVNVAHALRRS
jgi:hypothetical protein